MAQMAANTGAGSVSPLQQFAQQFMGQYYSHLDGPVANRAAIASMYHQDCQMSYEGNRFVGKDAVAAKFASLNMAMIHDITSFDVQQFSPTVVLITALGQFRTDGEEHALGFTQTFLVMAEGGTYLITNDIYRLALFNNA